MASISTADNRGLPCQAPALREKNETPSPLTLAAFLEAFAFVAAAAFWAWAFFSLQAASVVLHDGVVADGFWRDRLPTNLIRGDRSDEEDSAWCDVGLTAALPLATALDGEPDKGVLSTLTVRSVSSSNKDAPTETCWKEFLFLESTNESYPFLTFSEAKPFTKTPSCSDLMSTVTLSVSTTTIISSTFTRSPGCFIHFEILPSVIDSPKAGTNCITLALLKGDAQKFLVTLTTRRANNRFILIKYFDPIILNANVHKYVKDIRMLVWLIIDFIWLW